MKLWVACFPQRVPVSRGLRYFRYGQISSQQFWPILNQRSNDWLCMRDTHIFHLSKTSAYGFLCIDARSHHLRTRGSSAASLGSREGWKPSASRWMPLTSPSPFPLSRYPPAPEKPPSCFNPWRGTAGRSHRFSTCFRSRYHEAYFWCMKEKTVFGIWGIQGRTKNYGDTTMIGISDCGDFFSIQTTPPANRMREGMNCWKWFEIWSMFNHKSQI